MTSLQRKRFALASTWFDDQNKIQPWLTVSFVKKWKDIVKHIMILLTIKSIFHIHK